ncbi:MULTISPECIES: hypothetical protein [unclassified Chelatococcus]|jgi:hypothetical protein|uniref:hypothetical protein n=1 Tax=unclassified Chelatococcus TaxID=2638111 RepID=UPI001BCA6F97|nr:MULTISPECIES: hypothetical protein [unclassified Chelatococcus]CAH1654737.1 conserved membrane hypothetical protein [Hyphomicrobiales bacterium]MBS7740292.1 hypothetical protein [Chelatococcus sp. HY11]MBX3544878.1 hypothetical protein [Chelatococcus sp.]MCO5078467.1 hypothetical protein [Chelatococcus sp.]CAH1685328.1 conserved membrane hypothetical protein [Hyphomicrobiales bacterium]
MTPADSQRPDPTKGAGPRGALTGRLAARGLSEIKRFVILFLYLWVLFGLFVLNQRIILREHDINFTSQGFALINAFIMAKVMLILETINLSRWLHRRPLIYPIVHDAFLFSVSFIIFHVAEEMVLGLFRGETAEHSVPTIGGGGLAGIVCVAVILFFALIPFFAFQNFNRALGPGRMKAMLFGLSDWRSGKS